MAKGYWMARSLLDEAGIGHHPVSELVASQNKRPGASNSLNNCGLIPDKVLYSATPSRASFNGTKKDTAVGRVAGSRY